MSTVQPARPTVSDVATIIRARTKDSAGSEGMFSSDTRPTDAQVADLIVQAEGDVLALTGTTMPADAAKSAKSLIAIRAAMLTELSYWPEQVRSDRSAYAEYKLLYDEGLASLLGVLFPSADGGGGTPGPGQVYDWGVIPVASWTTTAGT